MIKTPHQTSIDGCLYSRVVGGNGNCPPRQQVGFLHICGVCLQEFLPYWRRAQPLPCRLTFAWHTSDKDDSFLLPQRAPRGLAAKGHNSSLPQCLRRRLCRQSSSFVAKVSSEENGDEEGGKTVNGRTFSLSVLKHQSCLTVGS